MGEAVNDRKESSAFSSTDADGLWCAIGVGRCTIDGVGEMRSERLSRDGLASANTSSSRNAAVLRKRKEKAKQCGQIRIGQVRDRKINSLWRNGRQGSEYKIGAQPRENFEENMDTLDDYLLAAAAAMNTCR